MFSLARLTTCWAQLPSRFTCCDVPSTRHVGCLLLQDVASDLASRAKSGHRVNVNAEEQ
jgi:hypothetical protein